MMTRAPQGRLRGWLTLLVAAALWCPSHAAAQQDGQDDRADAVVVTHAGRTFNGKLVRQDSQTVVLSIAGIDTPFDRDDIARLDVGQTVSAEYAQRKAELDRDDPDAWYQLAYFLFDRERYDTARQEVQALLERHPGDEPARRLRALIDSRILLRDQRSERPDTDASNRSPDRPAAAAAAEGDLEPAPGQEAAFWLSAEDINKLRVWELPADLADARPRIVVPRDVIDELFERYPDDPALPKGRDGRNRFRALPGWQQLDTIFRLRARELYPRVQVVLDPEPLQAFRGQLNPAYVVGYFRRHFGTGQVPGLYLHRHRPNAAPSAFANFLSLTQATFEGEQFINRATPRRSLLLQWGLPRDQADVPAPAVAGWRPFFTGIDDPRFDEYADWIASLYDPTPDYGIDYTIPTLSDVLNADPDTSTQP
jgi:hypothetical protein